MLMRAKVWSLALYLAFACAVGWIFIPGECVVQPVGTPNSIFKGSVFHTFLYPFAFDWVYVLYLLLKLSPIALVALAAFHWQRRFEHLRAVAALYTLALSAAVALHPYRAFSDVELIIVVSIWGIVVLVAYESKASPGSALLALMSIQLVISEVYSGLGADRGLPFWILVICLLIVFSYGIFHYTRTMRHSVLGRYTEIRRVDPASLARRNALLDQQRRLEQQP